MSAGRPPRDPAILPEEISLGLLCLLAKLAPGEREGWVDAYILGVPQRDLRVSPADPSRACASLRRLLGDPAGVLELA